MYFRMVSTRVQEPTGHASYCWQWWRDRLLSWWREASRKVLSSLLQAVGKADVEITSIKKKRRGCVRTDLPYPHTHIYIYQTPPCRTKITQLTRCTAPLRYSRDFSCYTTSTTVRTFFFQVVESATLAHYNQVDEWNLDPGKKICCVREHRN